MKRLVRSRWPQVGVGIFLLFVPLFFIAPRPYFGVALNGLLTSLGSGVLVTYWPAVWEAIRRPQPNFLEYFLVGLWLSWVGVVGRSWSAYYARFLNSGSIYIPGSDGFFWLLPVWILCISAAILLTAPGALNGRVPKRNWIICGFFTSFGIVITLIFFWWARYG